MSVRVIFTGVMLCGCIIASTNQTTEGQTNTVGVTATDSYLDNVGNLTNSATLVDLAALGVSPGDTLRLEALGDFSLAGSEQEPMSPISTEMIGVFSSSPTLLLIDPFNPRSRVPDAIEAGVDVVTDSDISQDFFIDDILIQTPTDASHLFVAPLDGFVGDNQDDNSDFAIRISVVTIPEPASVVMLALVPIAASARRRRHCE